MTQDGRQINASKRPRHIRDIAHLYLSRQAAEPKRPALNICSMGDSRRSLPAFHVANLAAAFSMRAADVRVYELSGLLPNVSFYSCHHPRTYVGANGDTRLEDDRKGIFAGLAGVSVVFETQRPPRAVVEHAGHVNLVHAPPACSSNELTELLSAVSDEEEGNWWGLILAGTGCVGVGDHPLVAATGLESVFFLSLDLAAATNDLHRAAGLRDLGCIGGWERVVADRVPVVLRDPKSALSKAYLSICDSMMNQIGATRRKHARTLTKRSEPNRLSR